MAAATTEGARWAPHSGNHLTSKADDVHHAREDHPDVYEMEDKGAETVKAKYVGTEADQKDMSQLGKIQELRVGDTLPGVNQC